LSLAHSLSATKRIRQNEKRRERNRSNRSQLRTQIKKVRKALDENDIEAARALLPETASVVDRMVKKGVIHANTGSRYMSRLASHVSAGTSS
jgi:small subunit ribosomal protein S20